MLTKTINNDKVRIMNYFLLVLVLFSSNTFAQSAKTAKAVIEDFKNAPTDEKTLAKMGGAWIQVSEAERESDRVTLPETKALLSFAVGWTYVVAGGSPTSTDLRKPVSETSPNQVSAMDTIVDAYTGRQTIQRRKLPEYVKPVWVSAKFAYDSDYVFTNGKLVPGSNAASGINFASYSLNENKDRHYLHCHYLTKRDRMVCSTVTSAPAYLHKYLVFKRNLN